MAFDIYNNSKFAELLFNWSQEENEESSPAKLGKDMLSLLIDLELENRKIYKADENTRKQIQKDLIEKNKNVPRIGGNQTVSQEGINKILMEDFDGGINLLLNHMQEKAIHIKEYISESQRKKAQKPRSDLLNHFLLEMLEENPSITESEVIESLKSYESMQVYIIDEDEGIVVESESSTKLVKLSALKNRLSRCRAKIICK